MSFQPSKYTSCGPYFRQPSSHPVLQPPRTGYLTIRVLIFEWDQNDPILQIDPELAELEKLFREEYRFDVKRVKMGSYNPEGDVQAALLRMFDQTTDVRDPSLLIIFYNGHGVETYSRERTRYEMKWGRSVNHQSPSSGILYSFFFCLLNEVFQRCKPTSLCELDAIGRRKPFPSAR